MTAERFNSEKIVLEKYFPRNVNFVNIHSSTGYVEVGLKTQSGNIYKLKIEVNMDYPNSKPEVYVSYPGTLTDYYGNKMLSASQAMHTLFAKSDMTQICHTWDKNWTPKLTLYKVVMKARLWLEAYEGHKKTGNSIEYYLNENQ
jgi:ubiquitin-protein ligase